MGLYIKKEILVYTNLMSNELELTKVNNSDNSDSKKFTIYDKKILLEDISKLDKIEHIEIFKIFRNDGIKYSENSNGIFINISKVPDATLLKVTKFLLFYKKNNEALQKDSIERKKLEYDYFTKTTNF